MPRVVRKPRNSVQDRPTALRIMLRRQRWLLRPLIFAGGGLACIGLLALTVKIGSSAAGGFSEKLGSALGLRVTDIEIDGRNNTPAPLLQAALGVSKGDPTLGFSVAAARSRIESLAWVEHATVERRLPGQIVVQLTERRPFAVWQNNHKFVLIDRDGAIVADQEVSQFKDLPLVVGAGAPQAAATLLDALRDRPTILSHVVAATRVGERRWNLRLNSGGDVLLPEGAEIPALDRLMALQQDHAVLDRPLKSIDMRLPDRLVITPMPSPDSAKDAPPKPA